MPQSSPLQRKSLTLTKTGSTQSGLSVFRHTLWAVIFTEAGRFESHKTERGLGTVPFFFQNSSPKALLWSSFDHWDLRRVLSSYCTWDKHRGKPGVAWCLPLSQALCFCQRWRNPFSELFLVSFCCFFIAQPSPGSRCESELWRTAGRSRSAALLTHPKAKVQTIGFTPRWEERQQEVQMLTEIALSLHNLYLEENCTLYFRGRLFQDYLVVWYNS